MFIALLTTPGCPCHEPYQSSPRPPFLLTHDSFEYYYLICS